MASLKWKLLQLDGALERGIAAAIAIYFLVYAIAYGEKCAYNFYLFEYFGVVEKEHCQTEYFVMGSYNGLIWVITSLLHWLTKKDLEKKSKMNNAIVTVSSSAVICLIFAVIFATNKDSPETWLMLIAVFYFLSFALGVLFFFVQLIQVLVGRLPPEDSEGKEIELPDFKEVTVKSEVLKAARFLGVGLGQVAEKPPGYAEVNKGIVRDPSGWTNCCSRCWSRYWNEGKFITGCLPIDSSLELLDFSLRLVLYMRMAIFKCPGAICQEAEEIVGIKGLEARWHKFVRFLVDPWQITIILDQSTWTWAQAPWLKVVFCLYFPLIMFVRIYSCYRFLHASTSAADTANVFS